MGYEHSLNFMAQLRPGTTRAQLEAAMKPLTDYWGSPLFEERGFDVEHDPDAGTFYMNTYGEVGYGYFDTVSAIAANLGQIASEAGEIELYDHDTGDLDNAKAVIMFGPSEESINAYVVKRDIAEGLELMKRHLPAEKIEAISALIASSAVEGFRRGQTMATKIDKEDFGLTAEQR